MPRTYPTRSFAPYPHRYSSTSFAPITRPRAAYNYVNYLLREHPGLHSRFIYFCNLCYYIETLERLTNTMYDNRDRVFREMATNDFVHLVQPFLRHQRRLATPNPSSAPLSSSSTSSNRTTRYRTPPESPPAYSRPPSSAPSGSRDNPILVSRTPSPPAGPSQFTSPLLFASPPPCSSCGGRELHYRECTLQT